MSLGRIEASPHRNEVLRVESESLHRMTFARWPPAGIKRRRALTDRASDNLPIGYPPFVTDVCRPYQAIRNSGS